MPTFANASEAKEFLIAEITDTAAQEGHPLTPEEIEILHCPGIAHPDEKLPQDYFENEETLDVFENRMQHLIHARRANPATDQESWRKAIAQLQTLEDDYLLILIDINASLRRSPSRPFFYWLKILAFAAIFGLAFFLLQSALNKGH